MASHTRAELIHMIERLIHADGSEEELRLLRSEITNAVIDPKILEYIYHPSPETEGMTSEQIADKALSYVPIIL